MGKAFDGAAHLVKIVTEEHGVNLRTGTRRPVEVRMRVYKVGAVRQTVVIGLQGWNCKAPDVTFVYRGAIRLNLIDPSVIGRTGNEAIRDGSSGNTNSEKRLNLVGLESRRAGSAIFYIGKILAEIDIV